MRWVFFFSTEEQSEGTCPKPQSGDPRGAHLPPTDPCQLNSRPHTLSCLSPWASLTPSGKPCAAGDDDDRAAEDRTAPRSKETSPRSHRERRKEPPGNKGLQQISPGPFCTWSRCAHTFTGWRYLLQDHRAWDQERELGVAAEAASLGVKFYLRSPGESLSLAVSLPFCRVVALCPTPETINIINQLHCNKWKKSNSENISSR